MHGDGELVQKIEKQFVVGNNLFAEKFVQSWTQRLVENIQFLFLKLFSRFFTYGDLPLEQHLKQIEEEALSKFERITPNTEVPAQPRWSSPVSPSPRQITRKISKMNILSHQSCCRTFGLILQEEIVVISIVSGENVLNSHCNFSLLASAERGSCDLQP